MSLEPIQWMRYDTRPRLAVGSIVTPIYKYTGYVEQAILPRGMDARNQALEGRRMISKAGDVNRLILDRPYQ
tara:strand:+ start:58 stop:273 length:216 start_codon:yes stop_codon:yes gene_type:complete